MLDAISALSALAAGVFAPAALRRAAPVIPAEAAERADTLRPDSLELSPGHIHDGQSECPLCRSVAPGSQPAADEPDGTTRTSTESTPSGLTSQKVELSAEEQDKVRELRKRDQEVRTHEQSHRAAGGQHAGSASYSYTTGPDGKHYATSGEVPIDLSPVSGDPQATIAKMRQIRSAALAPAQPSAADQRIAAEASRLESQARAELTHATGDPQTASADTEDTNNAKPASPYQPEGAGEPRSLGTLIDVAA